MNTNLTSYKSHMQKLLCVCVVCVCGVYVCMYVWCVCVVCSV